MPRHATPRSYGGARANPSGDQRIAGNASAEIARMREKMRRSVNKRFKTLEAIADGEAVQKVKVGEQQTEALISASPADRIKALDTLLKYGVGTTQNVDLTSGGKPILPVAERNQQVADIVKGLTVRARR